MPTLNGELDLYTAPRLLDAVDGALAAGSPVNLLVDAGALTFCDSHGLEAQGKVARAGGNMELGHVSGRLRRVLDLSGLSRAFTIV
ncbi:STAS domain-containing protein [Nonomuraea diastatica]|uniref:Anti-sigma factor antagonist n=1 Tax=Nonomuraea diastatica TaxID=1848329 RepID=A0A4V2YDI0_9ACTN|nr:STAS domain-containing protein [Nonomuraea diastatica]TDD15486.1 anti-sigma factor antagonist [Nonomuraea diastatica]